MVAPAAVETQKTEVSGASEIQPACSGPEVAVGPSRKSWVRGIKAPSAATSQVEMEPVWKVARLDEGEPAALAVRDSAATTNCRPIRERTSIPIAFGRFRPLALPRRVEAATPCGAAVRPPSARIPKLEISASLPPASDVSPALMAETIRCRPSGETSRSDGRAPRSRIDPATGVSCPVARSRRIALTFPLWSEVPVKTPSTSALAT